MLPGRAMECGFRTAMIRFPLLFSALSHQAFLLPLNFLFDYIARDCFDRIKEVDVILLVSLSRGNSCGHDGCNDHFSRILMYPST